MEFFQIPGSLRLSVHLCLWNRAKCCHRWVLEASPGSGWRTRLWTVLAWREGMLCWDRAECPCPPRALAAPTAHGGRHEAGTAQGWQGWWLRAPRRTPLWVWRAAHTGAGAKESTSGTAPWPCLFVLQQYVQMAATTSSYSTKKGNAQGMCTLSS